MNRLINRNDEDDCINDNYLLNKKLSDGFQFKSYHIHFGIYLNNRFYLLFRKRRQIDNSYTRNDELDVLLEEEHFYRKYRE